MATTAFVREIHHHSFMSIKCKEPSPDHSPESSSPPNKMPPTEPPNRSSPFNPSNQDSEVTSSDSNDMTAAVYPYSALQQMQAAYSSLPPATMGYSKCRFCDYVPESDADSKAHEIVHFPFRCSTCSYMAKTEGRLKSHETKYHSTVPPSTWVGTQQSKKLPPDVDMKPLKKRPVRCKLCNAVSGDKNGYYVHLREAHDDPKLLKCDQCLFATHYKHHLEYHLRNHFGSKPYSCELCNYSCVNKSMLNSHRKSHSNVYQFRCSECPYVTKYCHSLKLHLNKYKHRPGETLNPDGTPNRSAVIDVHGRRRGPKAKKKLDKRSNNNKASEAMTNFPSFAPVSSLPPPVLLNPKVYNNFSGTVFYRPSLADNSNCSMFPPQPPAQQSPFQSPGAGIGRCPLCSFNTDSGSALTEHIMTHMMEQPWSTYGNLGELMMRMRINALNPSAGYGMHIPPNIGEISRRESSAKAGAPSPTNGYSSDAYSPSPRSNQEAYSAWLQQSWSRSKTSTPEAKPPAVLERCNPPTDSVLDLSMKNGESKPDRHDSSSSSSSQSSPPISGANGQSVPPTKNRRKGKAFRLDCYARDEEVASEFTALNHFARYVELPRTPQNSVARSPLSSNLPAKRRVDAPGNNAYKKMASSPPNNGSVFHQPFFSSPFTPSTSQSTASSSHASYSPHQSLSPSSSNATYGSPDRSYAQQMEIDDEDKPVPKVVIKVEPKDPDSIPDVTTTNLRFKCDFCDLIFGEHAMFVRHNSYHKEGDPYTCGKCGVKCYDSIGLYDHLTTVPHPNEDAEISVVGVVKR